MQPKFFGYLLFLFIFSAFSLVLTSSLDAKIIGDRTSVLALNIVALLLKMVLPIVGVGLVEASLEEVQEVVARKYQLKLALVNMAQLFLKKIRLFKLVRGIIQLAL